MNYTVYFTRSFSDNVMGGTRMFFIEHQMKLEIVNVPAEHLSKVVEGLIDKGYDITSVGIEHAEG